MLHVEKWEPNDSLSDVRSEGTLWIFLLMEMHKEHLLSLLRVDFNVSPKEFRE